MPNIKKLIFPYSQTGLTTVYIVMKQVATEYFFDHVDGKYRKIPANPYIPLPELSTPEQGTYRRGEDREEWSDGLYRGLVYPDATGTKAPIGSEEMYILDDTEVVIDPQIIRDAMKLAPTAGTPADGSIDKHLDDLDVIGSGTNSITITVYKHGTTTPIPDYNVDFYNSDLSVYYGKLSTDSMGQIKTNIDSGTYKLKGQMVGYTPDNATDTFIISPSNLVKIIYATQIAIGAPGSAKTCRVWTVLRNQDDLTIPAQAGVSATAYIRVLPLDYNGSLHSGATVNCTFRADYITTGIIYWDLAWTARVRIETETFFGSRKENIVVPELESKELGDLII